MSSLVTKAIGVNASRLHTIGQGACGTVWAVSERGPVFNREDGGPGRLLRNEIEMHHRIIQSFLKFKEARQDRLRINVSTPYKFIKATDQNWWVINRQLFPPGYTPCNMICSERIPPFSQTIRQVFITNYRPSKVAPTIINSEPDKDCLIRLYLGRRRTQKPHSTSRFTAFSLGNFPLHLDQLESLGTTKGELHKYAITMAETLAVILWIAKVDGNDIGFVLAPSSQSENKTGSCVLETESHPLVKHSMWVLDFDLCRVMTMDVRGVEQCVAAFWRNDPHYPRPNTNHELWAIFREHYIRTSDACTTVCEQNEGEKRRVLSRHFIYLLEHGGEM
ncbi:hypothetical protein N7475_002679 [Penicillium sp. IBT 31633x]|nr:hypothetical protein N7475_002679 [Penicillium sp. IBT 31633x]